MPSNSSPSSRIATRAKNANAHPGKHEVPKRKRRTKAQIAEDKKKAAEKKQAQLEKREAGLRKIAELEAQLEAAEANEATPRPNFRPVRLTTLRRRETMLQIEIEDTDETDAPLAIEESEGGGTIDEYQLPSETALSITETEEDQPPKKKANAKPGKRSVRNAIHAYRVPLVSVGVREWSKMEAMITISLMTTKSSFVFVFVHAIAHARRNNTLLLQSYQPSHPQENWRYQQLGGCCRLISFPRSVREVREFQVPSSTFDDWLHLLECHVNAYRCSPYLYRSQTCL